MRRKCSSFSNEMHRKQKQIDELGTINIFNRRKNDALHNELNCARDEYNKAEELVNIKFKEWNVKPLEDYGPSCINDYDNSFVRRLHAAFSEIKSEKYDIFNTFYEAHNYISIATLALSIFYGLERTRMTGKQLQDAIEYYAYRLITKRNPLFYLNMKHSRKNPIKTSKIGYMNTISVTMMMMTMISGSMNLII